MKFLVIPCLKKSRYISPTYQKLKKKLNITVMNMLFEGDMFEMFLIRREKHDFNVNINKTPLVALTPKLCELYLIIDSLPISSVIYLNVY